ncbi:MAG: beta-propeller fold lactonase family protein [Terracidiphilus sp.]
MKLSKLSQLALVSAAGLLVAAFLTSCTLVTVDYIYVAASAGQSAGSAGQIYGYAVDAQSGAIRSALSAISSGGTGPVSMAATSDYNHLYVANQGNNTVTHFTIADSGALTVKDSVTLPTVPVAVAVNTANTYLYVVSGTTSATLTEYPLNNGVIGSPVQTVDLSLNCAGSSTANYASDTIVPSAVTVLASNKAVYVAAYDQSAYNPGGSTTSSANPGWVFGLTVGSGGALSSVANTCVKTPASGSTAATYQPYDVYEAGVKPSALAADPTSRFVYVTDYANDSLIGYTVLSSGALNFMVSGPFKTGDEPTAIVIDPRGLYIYVTNSLDDTVSAYTITLSTGAPSVVVNLSSSTNTTQTDPVALVVDPSLGRFLYTANHLDNSISGFRLDANTGALSSTQDSPYPISGAAPTALIAVPHGNHATQSVAP